MMIGKMLRIPKYAKRTAREALELRQSLPSSKRFGLDKIQAKQQGINSGVERARQIVNDKYMPMEDVERVCAFNRWLDRERTQKVQGAIDLWGGEKFIRKSCKYVKNQQLYK